MLALRVLERGLLESRALSCSCYLTLTIINMSDGSLRVLYHGLWSKLVVCHKVLLK